MKVKLLKKIRKRFSIDFYPNKDTEFKYELVDNKRYRDVDNLTYYMLDIDDFYKTKQQTLNSILKIVRFQYYKYSVKHKKENINKKVWYES